MKKSNPLVSIITLNLNGLKDTIKCLNSLKKTKYKNFEIILIDNGSEIDESKILKKRYRNFIKTYRLKKNLGFTGGNNWALNKTRGKYVVLLNNDTVVTPGWLDSLVSIMEKDSNIAITQPKLLQMNNRSFFDYAGAAGGYIDKYGYPFTRGRIFNTHEKDEGQYDGEVEIFWASGAACIIRKSVIKKLGGLFSENLFAYMEEIDFCWRAWRMGFKVMFTSNSVVFHKTASTARRNLVKKRFWEHRNNLYIVTNNLDQKGLITILPVRILLELTAYFYYFVSKQKSYIKSLYLAHLAYLKNGLSIRLKRKRTYKNTKLPFYQGSIIFDHFILKRKHFSDLNWSAKGNISFITQNTAQHTGNEITYKIANVFIAKGYRVNIYSIIGSKQNWYKLDANLTNISRYFLKRKPDVLIATFWTTNYLAFLLPARKRFFFSRDWGPSMHRFFLFKILALIAYKLPVDKIVHSNFLVKKIKAVDKRRKIHKINYRPLGPKFKINPSQNKLFSNKRKINVLSVISWYADCKGPDILVSIIAKLKKSNNFTFTLVSRENKSYSGVFDKFISNPTKNQLVNIYKKADVLLTTSRVEGFFIPGLEAMATGTLFITTNSGGVNEYAKNNYNSIIVSKASDVWQKRIISTTLNNKKKLNTILTRGFETADKYWDTNITDDLEKILFG